MEYALGQRFALQELHYQDEVGLFFKNVVQAAGIRMSDLGGGASFFPEAALA
jgi:hypothetical protein